MKSMKKRRRILGELEAPRRRVTLFRVLCSVATAVFGCLATAAFAQSASYTYDSFNRLTQVTYENGSTISYTYDAAGNRLTYSGIATNGGDTVAPSISILSPTVGATYSTAGGTVTLAGIAYDNFGVSKVTWEKDQAQRGLAIGTTNWSIPNLPLHPGANYFYIYAHDEAYNVTEANLTVIYTLAVTPTMQFAITGGTLAGGGDVTTAQVAPTMQFTITGGGLNLKWPASAGNFALEYADSLSSPILWSNAVATVTTNAGFSTVTLPATNAQRFFRLRQP